VWEPVPLSTYLICLWWLIKYSIEYWFNICNHHEIKCVGISVVFFKVIYFQDSSAKWNTFLNPCKFRTMKFYAPLLRFVCWFFSQQKPAKCIGPWNRELTAGSKMCGTWDSPPSFGMVPVSGCKVWSAPISTTEFLVFSPAWVTWKKVTTFFSC
jgi:hypothetical protein